ncbi:hypothetical protein U9M48_002213 [Paspalum notatum var. saurae]|uniref:Legume lectin domain-containing protein n=1 Tax=Paspalum notatum var. saurae TaxID=547442 RepID=A0AAQ3PQ08_PASNO
MALRAGNSAQLLHLLLLLLLSTCFLLLPLSLDAQETNNNSAVPAAASLPPAFFFSFNFSNVSSYDSRDLYFEGNASARSNLVDLTCSSFGQDISDCTGRMSYKHPVPLYDDTTVASFSTSFTFVIQQVDDKDNSTNLGEGIAFFLSGYQSSLPPDSDGDDLGLLDYNVPAASGAGQFVAVEFNSFYGCIGININSATSSSQTDLPSGQEANGTWIATINFNNITAMLVASFRSVNNATTKPVEVRYVLQDNIKTLLPPEVEVGFSASTGDSPSVELNQILAWSFNSTLAAPPTPHKGMSTARTSLFLTEALNKYSLRFLFVTF